jgi:hypothetical protein
VVIAFAACGEIAPSTIDGSTADGPGEIDAPDESGIDAPPCTPTGVEVCGNALDDNCDGYADCDDVVCAGENGCPPLCGELIRLEAPLALPDGVGASYMTDLAFTRFDQGQTLDDVSKLHRICLNIEHSWMRDLQIEIACPSGTSTVLQMFAGNTGSEAWYGTPNDTDDAVNPIPGTGAEYCWTPTATNPTTIEWANANPNPVNKTLPPGEYKPSGSFDALLGCPLNGVWTIKVTDNWAIDNGFIFSWSIGFDRNLVADCTNWGP